MICAMLGHRIAVAAVALATLSACATSTKGSGSGSDPGSGQSAAGSSAPNSAAPPTDSGAPTTEAPPSTDTETSPAAQPVPSKPVRTVTVHAPSTTYAIKVWTETTDTNCAAHAYGDPVIEYLQAHPCRSVVRLLATTKVKGKRVGFAQSSLGFVGKNPQVYTTAGKFRTLVTRDGTGNISDLLREGRRLPAGPTSVPSPDAFTALTQDASVTIVDAWYLDAPTPDNDPPLVQMAKDIYLQF
jgi:hypothetical protein